MSVPTIEGLIGIYTPFLGFKSAGIEGLSVRVGVLSSDSPCKTQTSQCNKLQYDSEISP